LPADQTRQVAPLVKRYRRWKDARTVCVDVVCSATDPPPATDNTKRAGMRLILRGIRHAMD
jgi:hypothetical protein